MPLLPPVTMAERPFKLISIERSLNLWRFRITRLRMAHLRIARSPLPTPRSPRDRDGIYRAASGHHRHDARCVVRLACARAQPVRADARGLRRDLPASRDRRAEAVVLRLR